MPRLTDEEMVMIRRIRLEYRRAVVTMRETGYLKDKEIFEEIQERRNRTIRALYEDGFAVKQMQAILGVSRHVVENAVGVPNDSLRETTSV